MPKRPKPRRPKPRCKPGKGMTCLAEEQVRKMEEQVPTVGLGGSFAAHRIR